MFPFAVPSLCNSKVHYPELLKEISLITYLDCSAFLRYSFLFLRFSSNQFSNTLTEKERLSWYLLLEKTFKNTGKEDQVGWQEWK